MTNWLFWTVPAPKVTNYILTMFLLMIVLPKYVFGVYFTPMGHLVNFFIYDALYYFNVKFEEKLRKDNNDRE
jgi:hypothetical protein